MYVHVLNASFSACMIDRICGRFQISLALKMLRSIRYKIYPMCNHEKPSVHQPNSKPNMVKRAVKRLFVWFVCSPWSIEHSNVRFNVDLADKEGIKQEISQTRYGLRCMQCGRISMYIPKLDSNTQVGPSCSTITSQRIFKIVVYRKRHTFVLVLCFLAFYLDFVSFYQIIQWNVQINLIHKQTFNESFYPIQTFRWLCEQTANWKRKKNYTQTIFYRLVKKEQPKWKYSNETSP